MVRPLSEITTDPVAFASGPLRRSHTHLDDDMRCEELLGLGSNNRVYRVSVNGSFYALRVPRRKSDTQQRNCAAWEAMHTLVAAQHAIGPPVYEMWHARHATAKNPCGLYVLSELYEYDLQRALHSQTLRQEMLACADVVGSKVLSLLAHMASVGLLAYDLKPSNMVLRLDGEATIDRADPVRIIDFGREFCEWSGARELPDSSTPVTDLVRRHVDLSHAGDAPCTRDTAAQLVRTALMLVQLSSTLTVQLHADRHAHRMAAETRAAINGVGRTTAGLLDTLQGRHVAILRHALRSDGVRGVLAHYNGRRNAGTRRTMRLARGIEP